MIAVDGSEQAQYAFDWYLENMYREGDHVVLIHCAEYHINIGMPGVLADVEAICAGVKKEQDKIDVLTNAYMDKLRAKNVKSNLVCKTGEKPGELICTAAKDQGVETIIMGTRGLGTIRRTLLGSVSEYVLHHANCPVTIVRNPTQEG